MGNHYEGQTQLPDTELVVVMIPFLVHSHVHQLFHLSKLISAYNIPVHFLSTANQLDQFHSRTGPAVSNSLIHFIELPTDPKFANCVDIQGLLETTLHLRNPVADYVQSLSTRSRSVAVVHEHLMSYVVQDVKAISNAETYMFHPLSAFDTFWRFWEMFGRPFEIDDSELLNRLPSIQGTFPPELMDFVKLQSRYMDFHVGELFGTSRVVEGEYVNYFERQEMNNRNVKIWAVGPFIDVDNDKVASVTISENRHECLRWLDLQPPNSVIYVSFGTIIANFSDKQIEELAIGLERSQQRFIWVVRSGDIVDKHSTNPNTTDLPIGFEERVQGRGLIVRGWAPQIEILGHSATGGFLSHCGWNSSLESLWMGVPIATWPMHSDQPKNAFLITDVLKTGLPVLDWARRDELVTRVVVEDVIRRLMNSADGDEIRKKAGELGEATRNSMVDGGISRKEIESFVAYMKRTI
uniref:zeatin O-glucosyltransferase-like n=1 Tax=Erigeron canadensis TaxID=72917 RepID=UPI001CB997A2|nr:zeatin O-glucosyltransferase-like [Erigeron canadensis]